MAIAAVAAHVNAAGVVLRQRDLVISLAIVPQPGPRSQASIRGVAMANLAIEVPIDTAPAHALYGTVVQATAKRIKPCNCATSNICRRAEFTFNDQVDVTDGTWRELFGADQIANITGLPAPANIAPVLNRRGDSGCSSCERR